MNPFFSIRFWTLVLCLGVVTADMAGARQTMEIPDGSTQSFSQTGPGRLLVISATNINGVVHVRAQNRTIAPVTATFDMRLHNLKANVPIPCTVTLAGNDSSEVFLLEAVHTNLAWNYELKHSAMIGSAVAEPDMACIYSLPYAAGSSHEVSQGYHGKFSHTGPDEYSIDWDMPVGTPVHAARGGLVVKSKDDSNEGGPSRKFESSANCILILHDDGTIGIYGHLKMGGNHVKVGDRVKEGDLIGLSGATGFTRGPHLHFSVFKAKDGWERKSLPVVFRSADHGIGELVKGKSYKSVPAEASASLTAGLILPVDKKTAD